MKGFAKAQGQSFRKEISFKQQGGDLAWISGKNWNTATLAETLGSHVIGRISR
jgi:hypothetical protein